MKRISIFFFALCLLLGTTGAALAQDRSTTGAVGGVVTDPSGAVVAGATVTVSGPTLPQPRTVTTDDTGHFRVEGLVPGNYNVKIEMSGFKVVTVPDVVVYVGKESTQPIQLQAGQLSENVTITASAGADLTSTAVGENLNDQLFQNIPVQRSVSSLFYLAPGTTDSLGGGRDNPSISGGSALDNLYVADGVNITDSAFGGIGTFTRSYGPLGTGINTSFVKEVQVKTGGFEPQYGQSTGGIINIITQSGSNQYHGAVYGFARPNAFEATRRQRDATSINKVGEQLAEEHYDAGVDLGGYVPGARDHLFFFGSFNPSVRRDVVLGAQGSGIRTQLGQHVQRYRTLNYAGKVDWNINQNHTLAFSIFGDPTKTNLSSFSTLNIDNLTSLSQLDYGTRNAALRYNGTLSKSLTLSATLSQNKNHFDETGFANFNQIVDRTQPARGNFIAIGRGFIEPTKGRTWRTSFDLQKIANIWGSHTLGVGYQFQRAYYSGVRDRSGPKFAIPATNATGVPITDFSSLPASAIGSPVNASFSLRTASASCTLCPLLNIPGVGDKPVFLRQDRGEYGDPAFNTFSNYHAWYAQDTWRVNKYVTGLLGIRWEQERAVGSPSAAGKRVGYTFTDQWAPRLGITVDPLGRGTMKVFYNFGRFFEYLPLDLAERSLSAEQDFTSGRFAPAFTVVNGVRRAAINQFGTVTPVIDAAHLLTAAAGGTGTGIGISANDPSNPILSGTKLGFLDEHIIGYEQQLPRRFTLSVRYLNRNLKRVVEDASVVSVEQFNEGLFGQAYFLGNINSRLDAAVNPIPHTYSVGGTIPSACRASNGTVPFNIPSVTDSAGTVLGAVCFEPNPNAGNLGSDGIPDGFPDPVHKYKAVEIELNKRFSNNWQLLSNWRIASLRGNYEGHLRNDNGQTDPGISSLFDFTAGEFGLLGDQFAVGPLNTDRRHVINVYGSYAFTNKGDQQSFGHVLNGLNLGLGFHAESGLPISEFLAHPAYLNAGEIPVGGRGKLGRTPWSTNFDAHLDYPWRLSERTRLTFISDFFNIFNNTKVLRVNEFRESTAGQINPDFRQPRSYHLPFNMRLGMRFEF